MEQEIIKKLEEQELKIEEITKIVKSLRNYFRWTMWITITFLVLPLLALIFVIPWFIGVMNAAYTTLPSM